MKTTVAYKLDITEDAKTICDKYWLRIKNNTENPFLYSCKEIGDEFGLTYREVTKIAEDNAYLIILDCRCVNCSTAKICCNRTEFISLYLGNWKCENCYLKAFHRRLQDSRRDGTESALQQQLLKENSFINQLIQFRQTQLYLVPSLDNIDTIDHYLLVAVLTSLGTDNLRSTISLSDNLDTPLSPSYSLDTKILDHLMRKNLLLVNIENSYDYVHANEDCLLQFNLFKMTFDFAYSPDQLQKLIIDSKYDASKKKLTHNREYKEWCQDIQLEECVSYLAYCSKNNNLAPIVGAKMASLLNTCLLDHSVSDIYCIIWEGVERASSYCNKLGIDKKRVSESVYTNIQKMYEKIDNQLIENKKHSRDDTYPKSVLTRMFFDEIHGIEDCGFKHTINDLLKQLQPYKNILTIYYPRFL